LEEQGIWGSRGFGGAGDLEEQGIWRNRGFEEQGIWGSRGFGGAGDLGEQGIWRNRGFGGTGASTLPSASGASKFQMERGNVGSIILSTVYLPG